MQQGEPSLEEILASIRKVMVSGDGGPAGPGLSAQPQGESAPAERGDGIEPAQQEEADDILDLEAHMLVADTPVAGDPEWTEAGPSFPPINDAPAVPSPLPGPGDVQRRDAASAVRESLAALERLSGSGTRQRAASAMDPALEALVRETLRPMLAEWLEANLPRVVERLVQAEIARIIDRPG